jgi:Skp family chaperone for outer membrane proteins
VRTLLLSAIVSGCLVSFAGETVAQSTSPSANASRFGIAVVDVSYIFKNYAQFKSAMDAMKGEMETAESQLKSDRDAIASKEEQRNQFNAGSPEYKQMDEEIARLKAEFNLKAGKIRNNFLEREAKVYYQTYLEVSNAVQYYGQQHNIGIVLRFNGDQIDPNLREDVLRAINKPVVYQNNIDITPDVLALLNRGGSPGGVAPTASRQQPQQR